MATLAVRLKLGGSLLPLSLAALMIGATPALAQPGTAEEGDPDSAAESSEADIVVTATLRETSLLEVPFSINAQTEQDIQRTNANTIEDLARNVAGLTVQNLGPGQSQVSIRGVSAGQIVRDQPGVKEQVGVYLDDSVISLSLFTPDLDLFDLNRVETLRGPQGTLFGAGSVGGTLRYITNQPDPGRVEGLIEGNVNLVEGGDWGGHLKGAVNLPLGETAAVRVVGYHTLYGGFIDALSDAGTDENVNDGRRTGGRVALRWEPSPDIAITPRVLYQEIRADGFNRQEAYNIYANPFTTTRPAIRMDDRQQFLRLQESFADDTLIADLNATIGFGGIALTSVSTYIDREIVVSRDASALTGSVSIDLGFPNAGILLPSNLVDTTDLETFTQELRLGSTGSGPLQWVVGGFYSKIDRFYSQRLPTPGYDGFTDARLGAGTSAAVANGFPLNSPYNSDLPYDIKQIALFGEATYDFGAFDLTAGGRWYDFEEEREFNSGGLFSNGDNTTDTTSSSGFSPRVILTYEADDDLRFNAQVSKGFRLGGVNDPLNEPLCTGGATGPDALTFGNHPLYDDETLWNYEVGVRGQSGNLRFSTAAFYTDITDLQVTADAGTCSSRVVFNVPKAHTMGVEFELEVTPMTGLDLSIAGSLIEAKFDSSVLDVNGNVIAGMRDGNRLPTVPKTQFAATARYSFPVNADAEGFFGFTFQHVGSRYTQPGDQESLPRSFFFSPRDPTTGLLIARSYFGATGLEPTVLDLRLPAYQLVNLSAGMEWNNGLGISIYVNNLLDENPLLSFDRERGGRARVGFNVGQPRVIGITARKRF